MRKIIAIICLGLFYSVFALSAPDAPKPNANMADDIQMRAALPQGGIYTVSEYLLQNDPKKFEEMKKLRLENPEEFEKQMSEISQKMRADSREKGAELKALSDKYRETGSDADKSALKGKLEEIMGKRIEMQKRRIEEMEKNIIQLKANIAEEEKQLPTKIDERLSEILSNKAGKASEPVK